MGDNLATIVSIVLTICPIVLAYFGLQLLADMGVFFTKLRQDGEVVEITRLGSNPHYIMSFRGHDFSKKKGQIFDIVTLSDPNLYPHRGPISTILNRKLGIYYIGLWPYAKITAYKFEWTEWQWDSAKNQFELKHRKESNVQTIFAKDFAYGSIVSAAETMGETHEKVSVNLGYVLVIRIVNPYKALHVVDNWFMTVKAIADSIGKDYVASKSYEELFSEQRVTGALAGAKIPTAPAQGKSNFNDFLQVLNQQLPGEDETNKTGLIKKYGVKLVCAYVLTLDIVGPGRDEIAKSFTAVVVETNNAKALVAKAEGERQARVLKAEGYSQAAGISGIPAERQYTLDTLGSTKANVTIVTPGTAINMVQDVRGGQPPQPPGTQPPVATI